MLPYSPKTIAIAVSAIALMALLGYTAYLKVDNASLTSDNKILTSELESKTLELDSAKIKIDNLYSDIRKTDYLRLKTEQKYKESQYALNEKSKELRKYKDRQSTVFAKPTLVQRLEQKALDKYFDEVANDY